jgi:hypothetical protein
MKSNIILLFLILFTYEIVFSKNHETEKFSENKDQQGSDTFVRGLYLTAYKTASSDFSVILDMAESAGINTIVFDLKNMNGDVFFKMPQNSFLTSENLKPIINIEKTVKTLHDRNMRAVSRIVIFHDMFNATRDSTLTPQKSDGSRWVENKKRGPCWLDSSHPDVQSYNLEIIRKAAKSGVDEIQMDYIRFPTQGYSTNASFYYQREDAWLAADDSLYIFRKRENIINEFIIKAKKICDEYNVTLTADVFAIVAWQREADIKTTGQSLALLSNNLDSIHPMIYSSHFSENFSYRSDVYNEPYLLVYQGTKKSQTSIKSKCTVVPYIQANSWKVNYNKSYILAQIQAIKDLKAGGFILWNSSSNYKNTLSWLQDCKQD